MGGTQAMKTQIWLITGSSRGLGRAFTEAALKAGHRVVATARNSEHLVDIARKFGESDNVDRWTHRSGGARAVRSGEVRCRRLLRVAVQRGRTVRREGHDRRTRRFSRRLCGRLHGASRRPPGIRCYGRRDSALSAQLQREAAGRSGKGGSGGFAPRIHVAVPQRVDGAPGRIP